MTAIRSILLHADAATRWDERLAYAASIARAFDADLTTLYAVDSVWSEHPLAMAQSPDAAAMLLQVQEHRLQEARAGYERAKRYFTQERTFDAIVELYRWALDRRAASNSE